MSDVPSRHAVSLPHPPAASREPSRRVARRRGLIAVTVLVFLAGGLLVAPHFWQIGRAVGPTCSVGVNGTGANVTVQGWSAPFACQTVTQRLADATHGLSAVVLAPRPADATAPVICRGVLAHDAITVRDAGSLKLVGTLLCAALRHGAPQ